MVEFPRVNPLRIGLIFALLYLVGLPLVSRLCICPLHVPRCSPMLMAVLASATIVGVVAGHELLHYLAALALRVEGVRLRLNLRLGAVVLDYNVMRPPQYVIVALAPQLLTGALIAASWATCGTLASLAACIAAISNLGGGIPDIVNAVYFGIIHRGAKGFHLLYDENGKVVGGVVEYPEKLVVYMFD